MQRTGMQLVQIILLVIHAILTLFWIFFFKAEIPFEKQNKNFEEAKPKS